MVKSWKLSEERSREVLRRSNITEWLDEAKIKNWTTNPMSHFGAKFQVLVIPESGYYSLLDLREMGFCLYCKGPRGRGVRPSFTGSAPLLPCCVLTFHPTQIPLLPKPDGGRVLMLPPQLSLYCTDPGPRRVLLMARHSHCCASLLC